MNEVRIIDFTRCPYCNSEWIIASEQAVCNNCAPQVDIDLLIADIEQSMTTLEINPSSTLLKKRLPNLQSTNERLNKLIERIKKKDDSNA